MGTLYPNLLSPGKMVLLKNYEKIWINLSTRENMEA